MEIVLLVLASIALLLVIGVGLKLAVRYYTNLRRSYRMTFLRVAIPKKESKEDLEKQNDQAKDFKQSLGVMTQFYEALYGLYSSKWIAKVKGQYFLSLEYVVLEGQIYFYIVTPPELADYIEKLVTSYYPDSYVEEVPDYNIFSANCKVSGRYLNLGQEFVMPLRTY